MSCNREGRCSELGSPGSTYPVQSHIQQAAMDVGIVGTCPEAEQGAVPGLGWCSAPNFLAGAGCGGCSWHFHVFGKRLQFC